MSQGYRFQEFRVTVTIPEDYEPISTEQLALRVMGFYPGGDIAVSVTGDDVPSTGVQEAVDGR